MERLRQEILEVVGPSRRPTFEDIRDMKYLRAVLNGEALHFSYFFIFELKLRLCRDTPFVSYRPLQRPVSDTTQILESVLTNSIARVYTELPGPILIPMTSLTTFPLAPGRCIRSS